MKKLVLLVIVLAAAGGGYYYYAEKGKGDAKPQVAQAAVTQGPITEQVQATGTLEAVRVYPVGSQVSGTVKAIYADFNTIVKKGDVLAEIDPSLLQAQVDLAQANYDRQVGEIANQKVQLEDARKQLERTQTMFDKGLANQQQLDQAVLTVKTRSTSVDSAEKALKQNQAQLDQAKLNVSYTIIRAPDDGVVVNRMVDVGQTVQSSMTVANFFQIATDLRQLKLNAGVDEADIGKIQPGMQVIFTVDSYLPQQFYGTVANVRLNAQSTNNVVTYPVWIDAPNPEFKLRPSMTATVRIITNSVENAVRVPNTALRFRPTSDIYTALGLTPPPTPTRGGNGRVVDGDAGAATRGGAGAATGRQGAAGQGTRAPGQAAAGQANGRGQGFGRNANLSPEERERRRAEFQANGGRGGRGGFANGGTGRGGRAGGRGVNTAAATQTLAPLTADKIDSLFETTPVRVQVGQVYKWDEAAKKLTEIRVTYGLSDGTVSQLLSGDLKPGDQVVTNVIIPQTSAQRQQNLFQPQGRGGYGGLQPGGNFGGGGGGGGRRGGGR
jgi:HlyD family secretion protein